MRLITRTVPVGDIEIACSVVGDGSRVVVLHGAIGLGSTYMRALDAWAEEFRLVHYDQRGSGRTPAGDIGITEITAANVQAAPERMIGSLGALDPMRRFATIRCPALVVHSTADPIPLEWTRAMAGTIPDADLALIEGGSHFPMVEDAESLRSTVVPWLRKHTP